MIRRVSFFTFALLALLPAATAQADATCDAAYDQAQTLRDAKKLVSAREQLRICGRSTCPASMTKDCTTWLAEIEPRIPSVVLIANDSAGNVVPNASVSVDGAANRKVDGTSWDVDPGEHTFTFTGTDGARVEKTVLVLQGQKDQRVAAVLGGGASSSVGTAVPESTPATTLEPPAPNEPASSGGFPYKAFGYTGIAVGAAGLVVGAIFGSIALSTKSSDCPTENTCKPGDASKVLGLGTVSTVGFIAGGVLAAGGLTVVLVAPKKSDTAAARVELRPMIGVGGAGGMLGGSW